ncbi:MAG: glycosyltransferase [Anaerolineae bacterium]
MRLTDLTVVVPTRNERDNITAFLASLPREVELILVDASDDETPDLAASLRPHKTRVVRRPLRIPAARQLGGLIAQTPWLLCTDADVVFAPDYFDRLSAYGASDGIYGPKLSADEYAGYYRWFVRGQRLSHALGIAAASGSNLLLSRRAFLAVGGFDRRLIVNEDTEIVWRVQRAGFRVDFAPDLIVYARDQRRLQRGAARKTIHSVTRCALLYSGLMPDRWRSHDWGYWT